MKEARIGGFESPVVPVITPGVHPSRVRVPGVSTRPPTLRAERVPEADLPDADTIDVHELRKAVLTRQGWLVPI